MSTENVDGKEPESGEMDMGYEPHEDETRLRDGSERNVKRRFVVTAEEPQFDMSYHPGRVLLYSPPRQMQRWDDSQILPRKNWGDLFFDLFYVAATYNVSTILTLEPTFTGLLYAAGTFLPVMGIWNTKTFYDARFVFEDDIFHRLLVTGILVVVSTAVLNIRSVDYLSSPKDHKSIFVFCLMLLIERIIAIFFYAEVYFFGVGQKKAMNAASLSLIKSKLVQTVLYGAAVVVSGLAVYEHDGSGGKRLLAQAVSSESTNVPIILILCGHLAQNAHYAILVCFCIPGGGLHKEM
jgi:hypothetical protein